MAIPKIIHYCWLSNDPVPEKLQQYMATWKKHMPDYEYIKWDFSRFDINSSIWVKEAFEAKKYAFAADYIRLYALYTMGGIYLDMDVEVLKPIDRFLSNRDMLCYESGSGCPEVAAFGVEKNCKWIGLCLDYYTDRHFIKEDGKYDINPLPKIVKGVLEENGIELVQCKDNLSLDEDDEKSITILPSDYFSPKSYKTGNVRITRNTYMIHQFAGSWVKKDPISEAEKKIWRKLGLPNLNIYNKIKYNIWRKIVSSPK